MRDFEEVFRTLKLLLAQHSDKLRIREICRTPITSKPRMPPKRVRTKTRVQIEALAGKSPVAITRMKDGHGFPSDAGTYDFEVGDVQVRLVYVGTVNDVLVTVGYR